MSRSDSAASGREKERIEALIDRFATAIDNRLRWIRLVAPAMAFAGMALIIRQYTRVYASVDAIPSSFFRRRKTMRCVVESVSSTHVAAVHRPKLRELLRPFFGSRAHHHHHHRPIRVDFAGVNVSNTMFRETRDWLETNVRGKVVACQLIQRNSRGGVDCLVHSQKSAISRFCVNEELLRKGFAIFRPVDGESQTNSSEATESLLKAQTRAAKAKKGLWKDADTTSMTQTLINSVKSRLSRKEG